MRTFSKYNRRNHFARPPRTLRNKKVRLDNIVLITGDMLPFKEHWQAIANTFPKGQILIMLPATNRPSRKILEKVSLLLNAKGHRINTIFAERLI